MLTSTTKKVVRVRFRESITSGVKNMLQILKKLKKIKGDSAVVMGLIGGKYSWGEG